MTQPARSTYRGRERGALLRRPDAPDRSCGAMLRAPQLYCTILNSVGVKRREAGKKPKGLAWWLGHESRMSKTIGRVNRGEDKMLNRLKARLMKGIVDCHKKQKPKWQQIPQFTAPFTFQARPQIAWTDRFLLIRRFFSHFAHSDPVHPDARPQTP